MGSRIAAWRPAGSHGEVGGGRRTLRATVMVVVTVLVAALLSVLPGVSDESAEAAYANSGSGRFKTSIDWMPWGAAGATIPNGFVSTNTRTIAGQALTTSCTISGITGGQIRPYNNDLGWGAAGFKTMYGGTGVSGISNVTGGTAPYFNLNCSATYAGRNVPLQGLVLANTEEETAQPGQDEWVAINAGTGPILLLDRVRAAGCTMPFLVERSANGRVQMGPPTGSQHCSGQGLTPGAAAVLFAQGASSATIALSGGGITALAVGVVVDTDFGDAPNSYGNAGAVFQPGWTGPSIPLNQTTGIFTHPLASQTQPATRLGGLVDSEVAQAYSADASGDDTRVNGAVGGPDDEDAIPAQTRRSVSPGGAYSVSNVSCTGPGFVSGWIDWNKNGAFDAGERSNSVACPAGGSVTLTWTVPASGLGAPSGVAWGQNVDSFLRLRIAPTQAEANAPTGMSIGGEVEDHPLPFAIVAPSLNITKSSTATADTRVGDTVTYTVRATNVGTADYIASNPARLSDDLGGVLDDATYQNDAAASRPGTLGYTAPVISWTGALAMGQTVELTYSVKLRAGGDGTVKNVAWEPKTPGGRTPVCDPAPGGKDAVTGESCATTTALLPRLTILKVADRAGLPAIGDPVNYTISVTNAGPGAFTANKPASMSDDLSDVLDDATYGADAVASTGTVAYDEPILSWSGPLAAGASATIRYSAVYTGTGDLHLRNRACVPEQDVLRGAPACDTVAIPGAQLDQWKTVEAASEPVQAGTELTYTLFFKNGGPADARIDAVDALTSVLDDAAVTAEPVATGGLTATRAADRITVSGMLAPNSLATVTYRVTVKADGQRGDDVASNFLLAPGETEVPETCEPADPERANCTVTPIGALLTTKSVVASSDPVVAGTVLSYTLTFESTGTGEIDVDRTDWLSGVLDDAVLTQAPAASDPALEVSDLVDDRFTVTGMLPAGKTVTVTYQVTVKAEKDRGDNVAANFLVPGGQVPPAECLPGDTNCTVTTMPNISVTKSSNPASGAELQAGDEVTYTLTFVNSGSETGALDHRDALSGVLDDAALTVPPAASQASVLPSDGSDGVVAISGTLGAAETATVTYTVTVNPDGSRGDNQLDNVVVKTGEPAVCGADNCTVHPIGELDDWKTVDPASGSTVVPGQRVTYTLHFENVGKAPVAVDREDVLTDVIDDAAVTSAPAASSAALSVSEIVDGRFSVSGLLEPGAHVTVTYEVTIGVDGERGDDRLANFLVPAGEEPPTECVPADDARADCTVNHVSDVAVVKTSNPGSGSELKPGQIVTYTLTFTNRSTNTAAAPAPVDYTDHMRGVLDDAVLTAAPSSSSGTLRGAVSGDTIRITGTVPSATTITVSYSVTVKPYGKQGDHALDNVVAITGEAPVCAPGSALCTHHQVPKPPKGLAATGGVVPLVALTIALLLAGGGGALAIAGRRRAQRRMVVETTD